MLLLDKPKGLTSNAALQQCKYLFFAAKAGHTGSLDPLATGVLPLCFGEATKFSGYLLNADKAYEAVVVLGFTSTTEDADGELSAVADASGIEVEAIAAEVTKLLGVQQQVPPMYSALRHEGQRLYDLARDGIEVEREARQITVHAAQLLGVKQLRDRVEVRCSFRVSKGTYIRSLASLLGERLGVGGYLGALRRTAVGQFAIDDCVSMEKVQALKDAEAHTAMDELLLPVEQALSHLPMLQLDDSTGFYLCRGNPVQVPRAPSSGEVALKMEDGRFIGIGVIDDDGRVAPRRLVASASAG